MSVEGGLALIRVWPLFRRRFCAKGRLQQFRMVQERIETLRQILPPEARARLAKDAGLAPAWMRPYLRAVAEETWSITR